MKSRNKKECKGKESTIGKIIYGFLLFMPLLAITFTCLYTTFNDNAFENYDTGKQIEYEQVQTLNDFNAGSNYIITPNATLNVNNSNYAQNQTTIYTTKLNYNGVDYENAYFSYYSTGNAIYIYCYYYDNGTQTTIMSGLNAKTTKFNFTYQTNNFYADFSYIAPLFSEEIVNQNNYLNNSFYYAVNKVEQSPLFNWAEDSVIYTGMTNTCNALDITNTFIPLIMTYWLIISVIYFLYDIILIILHVFHRKIHELEESI